MNQEQIILDYLQDKGSWVREGEINGLRTPRGEWIGYRGSRTTRDLIRKGKVESRMDGRYREVRFPVEKMVEVVETYSKGKIVKIEYNGINQMCCPTNIEFNP